LGLEFLKKKEETGKEIYSEFSKGMLSNVYNTESLKQNNDSSSEQIQTLKTQIEESETKVKDVDLRLQKGQEYKDNLLKSKYSDIDQELIVLNPLKLQSDITDFDGSCERLRGQIKEVKIVEPKEFYHEDKHDEIKDGMKTTNGELILAQNKVEEIEQLVK
jgi:hypothetical protein